MGLIKDAKQEQLGAEARRAVQEGRVIFAPRLNTPKLQSGLTGPISGWAELIEAVEREGWTLVDWTVAHDAKGRPEAYPLFRRAVQLAR